MIYKRNLIMGAIWWGVIVAAIMYGLFIHQPVVARDYAGQPCNEYITSAGQKILISTNGGACIQCEYIDGKCLIGTGFGA